MDKNLITNEDGSIDSIQNEIVKNLTIAMAAKNEIVAETNKCLYKTLSNLVGREVSPDNPKSLEGIPKKHFLEAIDLVGGTPEALIQPSHEYKKFSLVKRFPEIKPLVPDVGTGDILSNILSNIHVRTDEILREFTAENTERAFKGDLVYWQAWLSAVGYDFEKGPLTKDHASLFAIHHAEGLPEEIDQKLVAQGYKQALGPHKIATIKRRLASLSIALNLERLPNPTKDIEFRRIIEKLTKKYGEIGKKGRAITRDVLSAILDTCDDSLIGCRDLAVILFGWASGGRRRSEISDAELKDLESSGEDFIYHLPKSKTDQKAKGVTLPVNGVAALTLKDWISRSEISEGKIFRSVSKGGKIGESLSGVDINRIVKKRCKMAGYDPALYSAHSLRSGFITEAGRQRCPIGDAMALSTHKSVAIAMFYYRAGTVTNNSASNLM